MEIDGHTIKTIGDITLEQSNSEISIKTRASREERFLQGMETRSISFDVMAGTDPEDTSDFDAYTYLKNAYEGRSTVTVTYSSASGYTVSKDYVITAFKPTDPLDGSSAANMTLKRSAQGATPGSGSGSGS